jgi:hypothetical protein
MYTYSTICINTIDDFNLEADKMPFINRSRAMKIK